MRQGFRFLRALLSGILATRSDALLPRMVRFIEEPFQKLLCLMADYPDCRTEILMITAIRNTLVHRVSPMHAMG
jgi:hypothetical protein